MIRLTVEHKYCKTIKVIEGNSIIDAYRKNGLDIRIWKMIDIENF